MNVVKNLLKDGANFVREKSPEILLGIGLSGMATSVIFAIKDTPKAMRLIEKEKRKNENTEPNKRETVKAVWKCYIPTALSFIGGAACIVGSYSINHRRNAVLASAYSLADTALREYREKVIETIGEKKEREIRDKVSEKRIEENPVSKNEIIITGGGDYLCCDTISKRYFRSDIEKIRRAENKLNKRLLSEMYISLNELYYELGMSPTKLGNDIGWNVDGGLIEISFSYHSADNGEPCLVLDFDVAPRYDFRTLH